MTPPLGRNVMVPLWDDMGIPLLNDPSSDRLRRVECTISVGFRFLDVWRDRRMRECQTDGWQHVRFQDQSPILGQSPADRTLAMSVFWTNGERVDREPKEKQPEEEIS